MTKENEERRPSLVDAPAPPRPSHDLDAATIESYVRAAMHQDRTPGNVLVVCHPLRMYKVPRGLFSALESVGFTIRVVETEPDRVVSVHRIRDAFRELSEQGRPLDVLVISGDGSLDHHVLVGAFTAFYPDLVSYRDGAIDTSRVRPGDFAGVPDAYRTFLDPIPTGEGIEPTEDNIKALWVLRGDIQEPVKAGKRVGRILRKSGLARHDPRLRLAVLASLLPDKVTLRAQGFDLAGLAKTTQERTFQGLYPWIRSFAVYPAGTAADNALFAGVPGYIYGMASKTLSRFEWLDFIRAPWERRVIRRFVEYFAMQSVVVPARFSVVGFDGAWQALSSHAVSGPGGGHFFAADLSKKTGGLLGYLARIPQVTLYEGILGSTVVRIRAKDAEGRTKSFTECQMTEGLYTNRTFIAGVGSVPSTNPTSFAGQSTLAVIPPIMGRDKQGNLQFTLRGLLSFAEAIVKGVVARAIHLVGLDPGRWAGDGKIASAWPEHQITIKEGEEIDIEYLSRDGKARCVPTQVSGDPFQATRMTIRVAWGPLPLLANAGSLLLASAQRSLAHLRNEQTYKLKAVFIGGLSYYQHLAGRNWNFEFTDQTGLLAPPLTLRPNLTVAQQTLLHRWQTACDTGEFVDTSRPGLQLGRRGRYAHNNDQTAHLVVLKESRQVLLVRQVRAWRDAIYEARTWYRRFGPSWVIHTSQVRAWLPGEDPRILNEEHFFRSAEAFQKDAPAFFPFIGSDDEPTVREVTEELPAPDAPPRRGKSGQKKTRS